ncbi:MAG: hypothetical protein ABI639_01390 [Thermoanaerobaculia bacterium]
MRLRRKGVVIAWLVLGAPLRAQAPPHSDISWTAEHLPESLQDSRLLAFPWPAGRLAPGAWQTTFDFAGQSVRADSADATGLLASASATRALSERFALGALAFFDRATISGEGTRAFLRSSLWSGVPLDLPAFADFTHPRGEIRHWGAGGYAAWEKERPGARWRQTLLAGAYLERLEISRFRFDFELASGADTGVRGALDWSATYTFVTPFVGIGWTRDLGASWTTSPRLIAGLPLPRRRLEGTVSGPGFSIAGEARGGAVGDAYLGVNWEFRHRPTGLGFDLGSSLWFSGTEGVTHEGIHRAYLAHLSWSFGGGKSRDRS